MIATNSMGTPFEWLSRNASDGSPWLIVVASSGLPDYANTVKTEPPELTDDWPPLAALYAWPTILLAERRDRLRHTVTRRGPPGLQRAGSFAC